MKGQGRMIFLQSDRRTQLENTGGWREMIWLCSRPTYLVPSFPFPTQVEAFWASPVMNATVLLLDYIFILSHFVTLDLWASICAQHYKITSWVQIKGWKKTRWGGQRAPYLKCKWLFFLISEINNKDNWSNKGQLLGQVNENWSEPSCGVIVAWIRGERSKRKSSWWWLVGKAEQGKLQQVSADSYHWY